MSLQVEQLSVGQMQANCFLVTDPLTKSGIVIDPGDDAEHIIEHIQKSNTVVHAIIATHGHFDHIMAVRALQLTFKVPFVINEKDRFLVERMHDTAQHFLGRIPVDPPPTIHKTVVTGDTIAIDAIQFTIHETPGHTPGAIMLYSANQAICFVGDTVFAGGSVGRTDFSYSQKQALYASIREILALPLVTKIYSGHGEPTTVALLREYFRDILL